MPVLFIKGGKNQLLHYIKGKRQTIDGFCMEQQYCEIQLATELINTAIIERNAFGNPRIQISTK